MSENEQFWVRVTENSSISKSCHARAGTNPGKLIDIEMLVFLKGKERTEPEWRKLLEGASFRVTRIVQTKSPLNLIEAVPV